MASHSRAIGRSSFRSDELAGAERGLLVFAQGLLFLGAFDLSGVFEQVIERVELAQEAAGEARTDSGHAGNVIHRVAGKGQEIDDLIGADAPFFAEAAASMTLFLRMLKIRICSPINWRASLSAVTIRTSRPRSAPRRARVAITSSASTMGSVKTGTRKPSKTRLMTGNLRDKVVGHFLAVGLVFGKDLGAKHGPRPVERGREVVGLLVAQQVEQVAKDSEDGLGRLAGRTGHFRESRERLERSAKRRPGYRNVGRVAIGLFFL